MTEEKKKKSPYDDYMQMATDIYNEQKQQNLKQAENQSALAHAQYQEVNRNINEINKAKGLTDTGYQGDTSVDAYNVYRNSVNNAYSNANASNNQLYSYYLNQMSQLEQAKQNLAFQQEQFEYQKEQDAINNDLIKTETENAKQEAFNEQLNSYIGDSKFENGNISNDSAEYIWDQIEIEYGKNVKFDELPQKTQTILSKVPGFEDWIDEYNGIGIFGSEETLDDVTEEDLIKFKNYSLPEQAEIQDWAMEKTIEKYKQIIDDSIVNGKTVDWETMLKNDNVAMTLLGELTVNGSIIPALKAYLEKKPINQGLKQSNDKPKIDEWIINHHN